MVTAAVVVVVAGAVDAAVVSASNSVTITAGGCGGGGSEFCFTPESDAATTGAPVTWTNMSGGPAHTVTTCDATNCPGFPGNTGSDTFDLAVSGANGSTASFTFSHAGTYFYYCRIHGYAAMHGEVNVAAPSVTAITPKIAGQGANLAVSISGTGFASGDTASISGTGAKLSSVTVVSPTKITAKLSVSATAATGARDVVVNFPGTGAVRCAGCLTVTLGPKLTSVSPSTVTRGQSFAATASGSQFVSGATLRGPKGVTFSKVTFVNATTIKATMTVSTTATTGTNLVVTVTNPASVGSGRGSCACLTVM